MNTTINPLEMRAIKEAISKGVEYLNETYDSTWFNDIDLAVLDMGWGDSCILGQLTPQCGCFNSVKCGFTRHLDHLQPALRGAKLKWAKDHGFYTEDSIDQDFEHLTYEWTQRIIELREAHAQKSNT